MADFDRRRPLAVVWSRSGRELFFLDGDSHTLMSVDVETPFRSSPPANRNQRSGQRTSGCSTPRRSPDGQRFLFIKEAAATNTIEIVVNWVEELRARLLAK